MINTIGAIFMAVLNMVLSPSRGGACIGQRVQCHFVHRMHFAHARQCAPRNAAQPLAGPDANCINVIVCPVASSTFT